MKEVQAAGLTLQIDPVKINDIELFEQLDRLRKRDMLAVSAIAGKLLDDEQKSALYDAVRTEDGRVPLDVLAKALADIITQLGKN